MGTELTTLRWVQSAQWAGAHALPLFFVLLIGSLVLTFVAARAWQLDPGPSVKTQTSLTRRFHRRMTLGLGLGLGVMVVGAALIAVLSAHLHADSALTRADQAFTDALALGVPQPALKVFAVLTHLGDTVTLTALCVCVAVALVVMRHCGLAIGWVVAVAGNGILNESLKKTIHRERPLFPADGSTATGFSFPSGHSSGSVVAYGMLAYLAVRLLPARWQLAAIMASVTLAITVGASRLLLRVHFGSDVIAGFASGAVWLAACVTVIEVAKRMSSK
jgi:membrane-associated phospholipid phosphatase